MKNAGLQHKICRSLSE